MATARKKKKKKRKKKASFLVVAQEGGGAGKKKRALEDLRGIKKPARSYPKSGASIMDFLRNEIKNTTWESK